ncbi:unnamed protein product [Caenorhabditis angaria]|uniref:Uncharacterized protein n=1 Tax=Caenorhabditis angaria TaxID=860376 RepID=A0A9P1MW43_9PELO|nr:unnamed protein product [Caenorhabditis angaria]
MAKCPSGVFARSICAAGCMKNEKCVPIQNEMWCCPTLPEARNREMQCSTSGAFSSGDRCDPQFPTTTCPSGSTCELNQEQTAHICCFPAAENSRNKGQKKKPTFIPVILPSTSTEISTFPEEELGETILTCLDGSQVLFENNLSVMCPKLGEPCKKAGFICQLSDLDDVFICCSAAPKLIPEVEKQSEIQPSCPFSYVPAKNPGNLSEVHRCLTLFSLDCPFGFTCLPSSTTDSYLCCQRKPL